MQDNYIFNEELRRFEPVNSLCQFCNQEHSEDMNKNYFVPIFKVQKRTELIVYSSVNYNKVLIGIPRCNKCYTIHNDNTSNAWVICMIVAINLMFASIYIWGYGAFYAFIPLFIFAIVTPRFLADYLIRRNGILTKKEGAKKDPLVRDFIISGWSFNQPTAR